MILCATGQRENMLQRENMKQERVGRRQFDHERYKKQY